MTTPKYCDDQPPSHVYLNYHQDSEVTINHQNDPEIYITYIYLSIAQGAAVTAPFICLGSSHHLSGILLLSLAFRSKFMQGHCCYCLLFPCLSFSP
uniref:Uncharacterized protein n=1 Tax=Neovison vison TaxID=452646 RepID=A0A8C7EU00_NEOVI